VPAEIVGAAISRLEKADLSGTNLSTAQCEVLLTCVLTSSTLKELSLAGVNWCNVNQDLFSNSLSKLVKVDLSYAKNFTGEPYMKSPTPKINQLLSESIEKASLKELNISWTRTDSERNRIGITPSCTLLSAAVGFLTRLNLSQCNVQDPSSILASSLQSTSLVELNMANTEVTGVDINLLAEAIFRLERANFSSCKLSDNRVTIILKKCLGSSSLVDLNLRLNELTTDISSNLVEEAGEKFNLALGHLKPVEKNRSPYRQEFGMRGRKKREILYHLHKMHKMHKKMKKGDEKEGDEGKDGDEDHFHQMMEEIEMLSDDDDDHFLSAEKIKYLRRRFNDDDDENDKHVDQIVKIVANNKA
jgi:uncharacterized protein YjbI with pentapeptide repeats